MLLSTRLLFLYSSLASFLLLLIPSSAQAEYWLSDSLYLENNQQLFVKQQTDTLNWQLLPEINLTQKINNSAVALGVKLRLDENNSDGIINNLNLRYSLSSRVMMIFGRQKIHYNQNDLFRTSLNKNDEKVDALNYSQGLRIIHRLGYIEQSILFNQQSESKQSASTHYQLKIGIPGYKVGPLAIALEYPSESNRILRGMLGSALQFPLRIVPGDWQWAFQYATEFNQPQSNEQAWQTSFSWLGFIPQHKVGVLFSHSDDTWTYSDDFNAAQDQVEMRYQWMMNQQGNFELSLSQVNSKQIVGDKKTETIMAKVDFSF
jgi:hypothetical protein